MRKRFSPWVLGIVILALLLSCEVSGTRVLDGALGLSGIVSYPPHSVMLQNYLQTWSGSDQLVGVALSIGISPVLISLYFSVILFVGLGLLHYAFCRLAGMPSWLATALTAIVLLAITPIQLALRSDYPLLLGSSWTHGELAVLFSAFILYLVVTKRLVIAGVVAGAFFAVHSVSAMYAVVIMLVPVAFNRLGFGHDRRKRLIRLAISFAAGLAIALVSLGFFIFNPRRTSAPSTPGELGVVRDYFQQWDFHRNIPLQVIPIMATLMIAALVLYGLIKGRLAASLSDEESTESSSARFAWLITLTAVASALGYVVLHFLQTWTMQNTPASVIDFLIPGRFMNLHAFLAFPLIFLAARALWCTAPLTRLRGRLSGATRSRRAIVIAIAVAVVLVMTTGALSNSRFREAASISVAQSGGKITGISAIPADLNAISSSMVGTCAGLDRKALAIAVGGPSLILPRLCHVPVALETGSIDVFAYTPSLLPQVKKIIQVGYGIDFGHPAQSAKTGSVNPDEVKSIWEARSAASWHSVGCALGLTYVGTPSGWSLKLEKVYSNPTMDVFAIATGDCLRG